MSVKINSMSATIFTTTPNGITKDISDNSTSASSTSFVKSFISSYLIPLGNTVTIVSTIAFSTIYLNVLKGVSSLILRGNLSIGGASTDVTLLGNTLNIDTNYPYILSSPNQLGSKIQAGYRYMNGQGTWSVDIPIDTTETAIGFCSPNISLNVGVNNLGGTSGFSIRNGTTGSYSAEGNWILFT